MAEESLRNKTLSGFFWKFAQKFLNQGLSFIVTVILARLLMPEDYGVVALAGMFNVLSGIFISGSMDFALVQKKDVDELDYNTVFFSSGFMSLVIYAFVYFMAPVMADIYHNSLLIPIMRVQAITMPLGAFSMVQNAHVTRAMDFKRFFKASLIGHITAAIAGIIMAYQGFGAWALVAQTMIGSITNLMTMTYMVRWCPKLMFSWERFKILFDYAWKRCLAGFMGTFCNQLKGYLIGYKYSTADLAYFNRGEGLPDMVKNNIVGTIDGVLFPALTKLQDNKAALKNAMRRSIMTSNFVLCPILLGLGAVSAQIVPILYSARWNPVIPFMQVACITLLIIVINNTNLQMLYATGRTDVVLKQEFIKKPVMLILLAFAIGVSPIAISIAIFFHACHELFWTSYAVKKEIGYSLREQLYDVKYGFIFGFIMAINVYVIGAFIQNPVLSLCIQILLGALIYIGLSNMFKVEAFLYIKGIIIDSYSKKKK